MNIFKFLFGEKRMIPYPRFYCKWNETCSFDYGPYDFRDILTRKWSGPPKIGRFENETKWRDFSYFLQILSKLKASQPQLKYLIENNIVYDMNEISMIEAEKLITADKKIKRAETEARAQEKSLLPATKRTLNKLDKLGIPHREEISRKEADELIIKFYKRKRREEVLEEIHAAGILIPSDITNEELDELSTLGIPDEEELRDFNNNINKLKELGINCEIPRILSTNIIDDINSKIEGGLEVAEGIIIDLKDPHGQLLDLESGIYEVHNISHDENFDMLKAEIITRYFSDEWDNDKQIKSAIKKFFPQASIKKIRDD